MSYYLSVIMPCYGRPQRTLRMVECIARQTLNNCEIFIIGDGCPQFDSLIRTQKFISWTYEIKKNGNTLLVDNWGHKGGYGYNIINGCIQKARGEYIIFLGNDDIVGATHFSERYLAIAGTGMDFAYVDTWLEPFKRVRVAKLEHGSVGHAELVIRTGFAKNIPPHDEKYGHDWRFIENMMKATDKHFKPGASRPTYRVMSIPNHVEEGID